VGLEGFGEAGQLLFPEVAWDQYGYDRDVRLIEVELMRGTTLTEQCLTCLNCLWCAIACDVSNSG
jgi:hypothetical protein